MISIKPFFHHDSKTFSYIVHDEMSKDGIVIDPVLDFAPKTFTVSHVAIDGLCEYIAKSQLRIHLIVDTHLHADHLSGSQALQQRVSAKTAIGAGFIASQKYFAAHYEIDPKDYGPAYDQYLEHNQIITAGSLSLKTLFTPGHTPTCTSILIDDAIFVGDTLFQPYLGCGRTDFPGGSAHTLFYSIKEQLYTLPDHYRIFVGHDYPADNKEPHAETTVELSKQTNIMLNDRISEQEFIQGRQARDKTLTPPDLLPYAMQVNILGGKIPKKSPQGKAFLCMPVDVL